MEKGVPIRTVSRSFAVLKLINRHDTMTLMEIARASHLPYPTAYRIVQTLVHEGLIECEPARKKYRVTRQVMNLSQGYSDQGNLVAVARPFIVDLTLRFDWPVTLTSGVGTTVMIRDSTYEMSALSFNRYYPGYTIPLLECAAGQVHLAFMEAHEREELLVCLEELDGQSATLERFRDGSLFARIRADGFTQHERSQDTANPGQTSSLAAPILLYGEEEAQLTLSYFSIELAPQQAIDRYAIALKSCAAEISRALEQSRA
ncbi:helix-turn-helix domain-containing protein [Pseudomonas sp. TH10]|uniref:helix-turn-helix domain-containing protein n=1 Tax=Pseudomonas sp. TH10 TaxID=2796376 RepID=UPI00191310D1|nr:helix-turn-helix domain-containing protein [Pseudomonas sp. TH10]MBK5517923.1 helix-turn-helix domain-containing protein [Pseudomonas sp. TH10]